MLVLAGCAKEPITVVTVPKERKNTAYQVPNHWQLKPPSGMRAVSFSIPDDHGHNGEASVLPMPRLNIDDIEIVNLWRQQVGLEPAEAADVAKLAATVTIGGEQGQLFDLASPEQAEDPTHAPRIVTAYLHADNLTWFFKLTGPSHFVDQEKPAFTQFLASLNLAKLQAEFQSRMSANQAPPPSAAPSRSLPEWTVPENWEPQPPPNSMVMASFSAGGADATVSALGGSGGGLLINVNRWRGQIGLSPIGEDGLPAITAPLDLNGKSGTLVRMEGPEKGILVAIVAEGGQTWFFKLMGPPAALDAQTVSFTDFVRSAKYPGNG